MYIVFFLWRRRTPQSFLLATKQAQNYFMPLRLLVILHWIALLSTMEENNFFCRFIFAMVVLLIKGRLIFSNFTSIRYLFSLRSIDVHSKVLSCKTTNYFADCYSNLLWLCLGLDSSLECLKFKSSNLEIVLLYKLVSKSSWLDIIKISRILILFFSFFQVKKQILQLHQPQQVQQYN